MTGSALVVRGDARRLPLPDESVDLIVTSPPYFALRDYRDTTGTGTTAHVAAALGRIGISVDLSGGYARRYATSPELAAHRRRKALGLDKPVVQVVPPGQISLDEVGT